MSIELVIDRLADAVAIAVLESGALVDLLTAEQGPEAIEERLFLARVTGIEPAIDGAFLDHGGKLPGFITGKDARHRRGLAKRVSIKHCLKDGEWLIVQGLRGPEGGKGARFTTDLRLAGASLVYRPHGREVTARGSLRSQHAQTALARGRALVEQAGAEGGLVMSRLAAGRDDTELAEELRSLVAAWQKLALLPVGKERRPGPLPFGPSPLARLLSRAAELLPARIIVADDVLRTEARRFVDAMPDALRPELEMLAGGTSAFAATGVDAALAEAVAREVPLAKGGRLIIEETAACVAIDVDGGGREALGVDLEAAAVIGRLVRLRNLGGTLVVDFVDVQPKQQRLQIEDALKRAFKGDPLPVQIYPMSPLGIVQISRARRGGQPLQAAGQVCSHCGGSGWVAGSS
jgi:ribonuclease E/ribonuclease G